MSDKRIYCTPLTYNFFCSKNWGYMTEPNEISDIPTESITLTMLAEYPERHMLYAFGDDDQLYSVQYYNFETCYQYDYAVKAEDFSSYLPSNWPDIFKTGPYLMLRKTNMISAFSQGENSSIGRVFPFSTTEADGEILVRFISHPYDFVPNHETSYVFMGFGESSEIDTDIVLECFFSLLN